MKAGTWEVTEKRGISQAFDLPSVAVEIIRTLICPLTRHCVTYCWGLQTACQKPEFLVNNLISSTLSILELL